MAGSQSHPGSPATEQRIQGSEQYARESEMLHPDDDDARYKRGRHTRERQYLVDDMNGRRYCGILFDGCASRSPLHITRCGAHESATLGARFVPFYRHASWLTIRGTTRPRIMRSIPVCAVA